MHHSYCFAVEPGGASEADVMRMIKRLVLLTVLAFGGVLAFNYWSDGTWPSAPRAAALNSQNAKQEAARLANRAATVASDTASKAGDKLQESALTAKIKAKMALDDHVKARTINVDSVGSVVTLTGVVASADERQRALRLASETEGVTRVVDKLHIQKP
jgi:hyperosmotically inducible protein